MAAVQDIWFARARARATRAPDADTLGRWNAASGPALRGVEAHAYRQAAEAYAEARAALPEGRPGTESGSWSGCSPWSGCPATAAICCTPVS